MKKRYWIAGASGLVTAVVATKLLTRPRDVDWQQQRNLIFHSDRSDFVEVDGVRVHYQEAGDAANPAVLLIHGFSSSTLVWSRVFLPLAEAGFRVLALDLLGYGYSGKPRKGAYTIQSQAEMVTGFLKALGIERVSLVGSSYGGAVAATLRSTTRTSLRNWCSSARSANNDPTKYPLLRLFGMRSFGDIVSPLLIGSRSLLRRRDEASLRSSFADA